MTVSLAVLVIGVLGLVSSMVGCQLLARSATDVNLANIAMVSAIEEFRFQCATNFNTAVSDFAAGKALELPDGLTNAAKLTARVITDESQLSPPIDLNANGILGDVITNPSALDAAVLEIVVEWPNPSGNNYRLSYLSVIPRAEVAGVGSPPDTQDPPGPQDPAPAAPTEIPASTWLHNQAHIADGCVIGENSTYEQQVDVGTGTTIGDNATVEKFATIGTNCTIGSSFTLKDRAIVGNNVTIGDNVKVDKDVTIGDGATILSGAHVKNDVPAGTTFPQ